MKNRELADLFEKMADILEFKGENPFKINLSQLEKALEDGSLVGLFGIGEKKIENIKRGILLLKQKRGQATFFFLWPSLQ